MVITDPNQLMSKIQEALDNTTNMLLNKLVDIIEEEVYSYDATWTNGYDGEFGRTGEFGKSWEKTKATIKGNLAESEIFQNYATMHYTAPFSHGSDGTALGMNELNNIIENGLGEHDGFPDMKPRLFWSKFEVYVDTNIDRIFITNCKLLGLDVSSGMISGLF